MSDTQEQPTTEQQHTAADDAATTHGQEPTTPAEDTTTDDGKGDLPDWARDSLTKSNREAAAYRSKLRDMEAKLAERDKADEERKQADTDFKQKIGQLLGFVDDDTTDPQALLDAATKSAKEAAAERDSMAAQLRQYRQQDAIRAAAGGADTKLLTALLQANQEFAALDPTADDYADQVEAHVKAAIEEHPSLRVQAAPAASGVDTSNTNRGADRPLTRDDLAGMTPAQINEAVRAGKLNHILGGNN